MAFWNRKNCPSLGRRQRSWKLLQRTQPDHSSAPAPRLGPRLRLRLPLSFSEKPSVQIQQHSEFYFYLSKILSLRFDQFMCMNPNGSLESRIIQGQISTPRKQKSGHCDTWLHLLLSRVTMFNLNIRDSFSNYNQYNFFSFSLSLAPSITLGPFYVLHQALSLCTLQPRCSYHYSLVFTKERACY